MKIEKFLDRYFYKEDIQELLYQRDLPISGKKSVLIKRLRKETNIDIFQLIEYMSKNYLKDACYDLDLKVSGTKDELKERVFNEIVEDWKESLEEGVVYYIKEGRIQVVLLWNVWEKTDEARVLIAETGPFAPEDLKGRIQ